jgi:aryl-alcohol dehydrogenase-like predicted oxidoreductase
MISKFMRDDLLRAVENLRPIAKKLDLTMAQLAVAWVLQNPNVSRAIIGATKPDQIKENVKAAGVKIPEEIMLEIDSVIGRFAEKDPAKTISPQPRA